MVGRDSTYFLKFQQDENWSVYVYNFTKQNAQKKIRLISLNMVFEITHMRISCKVGQESWTIALQSLEAVTLDEVNLGHYLVPRVKVVASPVQDRHFVIVLQQHLRRVEVMWHVTSHVTWRVTCLLLRSDVSLQYGAWWTELNQCRSHDIIVLTSWPWLATDLLVRRQFFCDWTAGVSGT